MLSDIYAGSALNANNKLTLRKTLPMTTEEKIRDDFEIAVQTTWADALKADPSIPPKAAFREGFSQGIIFATAILGDNLAKAVRAVEEK